jgi:serpin B
MTTPPTTTAAAAATRALALDLYAELRGAPGNLMLSPYSIWTALAMLVPGARGPTRDQLADRLGLADVSILTELVRVLATRAEPTAQQRRMVAQGFLNADSLGFVFEVANQLWIQSGYRITPDYGIQLTALFGLDPAPVDFAGAPDAAAAAINRWVGDRTHGKIQHLVDGGGLGPQLRAVLANAIYFKASWGSEFRPAATKPGAFHLADGSSATVPLMRQVGPYPYAEDADFTAVQLPYVQDAVAMVVLLPKAAARADADRALALPRLDALCSQLAFQQLDLTLPRFRFESSHRIAAALRAAGLDVALSAAADFSAISDEPGFGIGEVLHKTFIAVDEQGTEAAAVTAVMLAGSAAPPKPRVVRVDRPFYFLIRDVPTGTALFFGRVADPR